jgi:hypothetical protein
MKNVSISIILALLLNSCFDKFADHEDSFQLENKSNQNIYCYASYILPDTNIVPNKPKLIEIFSGKIGYIDGSDCNDPGLKRLKAEKLTIFVLNKDMVDKNTWDYIRVNLKILKRYEVTEKDILNMGGSVTYP